MANGLDSRFGFGCGAFPASSLWGIDGTGGMVAGEIHPIRVLGRTWRDADEAIARGRSFAMETEDSAELDNETSRTSEMSP